MRITLKHSAVLLPLFQMSVVTFHQQSHVVRCTQCVLYIEMQQQKSTGCRYLLAPRELCTCSYTRAFTACESPLRGGWVTEKERPCFDSTETQLHKLAHLVFICFSSLQTGSVPELTLSQPTPSHQMHSFKWKGVSLPSTPPLCGFQVWNSVHLFTHLACAGAWKHIQGLISASIPKHKLSFRLYSTFQLDQLAKEELQLGDVLSMRSTSHSVCCVLTKTFHFKALVFLKRGAVSPSKAWPHRFE